MRSEFILSEYISSQEDCAPESSVHIDCFGAVPNSGNDSSLAIQQAIDYCVANRISTVRITGVNTHAHQLKNLHYPQVSKNVILSKKLAR
ncbi:hypothetical protein FNE59_27580, partial [Bacillus thuringiensis]|nr:hypothetical protein [Bacillus thuringiensis]